MAYLKQAQTLAVEAVAGKLTTGNLTMATSGTPRYLAALTTAPSGTDPAGTSLSEIAGGARATVTWGSTNTGVSPVEVVNSGDIYVGPFSAAGTITAVALCTTSTTGGTGTVLSWVTISSRSVTLGDRLRFASGTVKVTTT